MTATILPNDQQTATPGVFGNLRELINIVDELRDVGLQQYINLPRICVVGTQSAGKSSVLEGIVGMDFLPRGDGVVTRRPLELRLIHVPNGIEGTWATFDVDPERKKMYDFETVRQKIDALTDEVAGRNKGIVDDPIVLTVCGPTCPDLTLVDLPGITRVPLKGSDQTDDIERLTRDMATRYAKDPRTVILAVIPANQDISTSDALQLARKVDPRGLRTIGVITKIDLMDRGTDAARMIAGEDIPLRLGYVAVKNRSQHDINAKMTIKDAIAAESEYFKSTPAYRNLAPHMIGTQSLIDKLTKVLFRHIRSFLPEIKNEIASKLRMLRQRMMELGDGVPVDPTEKTQLMWTMINDFCELFCNTIRGKYDKRLSIYQDAEANAGCGGAQIRSVFNELLEDFTQTGITNEMTNADIDHAIRMHEGDSLPGFPSPDTFEYLILPHLKKIHFPVMECLDKVAQCLEVLAHRLASRVFCRFPALAGQILDLTQNIMMREKEKTRAILDNVVNAETGYLFTNDPSYLTHHGSMLPINSDDKSAQSVERIQPQHPSANGLASGWFGGIAKASSDPQGMVAAMHQGVSQFWTVDETRKTQYSEQFLSEIRGRLDAYFAIVLRNVRDTVPKTIGFFLVRTLQDALQFELYTELNRAERYDSLLGEPPQVREERLAISQQIKTLQNATVVLQRDPAIASLLISNTFDDQFDWDLHQMLNEHTHPMPAPPVPKLQPAKPPSAPTQGPQKLAQVATNYLQGGRSGLFEAPSNVEGTKKLTTGISAPLFAS